jgi:hypothetical protein
MLAARLAIAVLLLSSLLAVVSPQ